MKVNEETTQSLHDNLKKVANINNLIIKGTYPGMAFLDIKEATEHLSAIHTMYMDEFRSREDAVEFEPNIHKIGTAELVDEQ